MLRLDSRTVGPDDLFCAIRGTRVDGHSFLDRVGRRHCRICGERLEASPLRRV
ncbi:MAG: Mur ligase domain-containing protein [Gemmatimonadota bacterium]